MIEAKDWWNVFTGYNQAIYPLQWIVMALAALLVLLQLSRPSVRKNRTLMLFLSAANLWNGCMFFIVIGTGLPSPLRFLQGALFIAAGIFLGIDAIRATSFIRMPTGRLPRVFTVLLLLLTFAYPLIGLLRGHGPFQFVYPGTLPCGTTALTLLLLSTALPKTGKPAYILLLLWAIPFAPLIQIPVFGVYEDAIMFIAGIYALVLLLYHVVKQKRTG